MINTVIRTNLICERKYEKVNNSFYGTFTATVSGLLEVYKKTAFSALTLLVGQQKGHPAPRRRR